MTAIPAALIRRPPSPTAVDFTALANFTTLGGQLRIVTSPHCNIECDFCHDEGDVPPHITRHDRSARPRRRELNADEYNFMIGALMAAGLTRLYFTGGEPLVSPLTRPLLEAIPPHEHGDTSATLITNGILVRRNVDWLRRTNLDKIKVSLHYFSDASLKAIANSEHGISPILDGIAAARETVDHVEINTLIHGKNLHEIDRILTYALTEHLPIQFIELVDTDFNADKGVAQVSADALIASLRAMGAQEKVVVKGVGQGKRVFTVDGDTVEVIHKDLGRHHVGQCGRCPKKPSCVEGFWALRADHAGFIGPCLLREDLRLDLKPYIAERDPKALAEAVAFHIDAFTEGLL
ncbi:radical SAM protein [Catenulispora rubra]|uniref:radical SAM protein n=1 Tax=Catenulispora rubra TaxID=280293 RepID=UPI001892098F|nr:radical SAM protein [Catenulispora rubra]